MDPNAALNGIRVALAHYRLAQEQRRAELSEAEATGFYGGSDERWFDALERLAELADPLEALDQWLSAGGLLPAAWDHHAD